MPEEKIRIEDVLAFDLLAATGVVWEREYAPCTLRKWRIDLALPRVKIAVEVEGREHARAARHVADCEKNNYLSMHGWRCFRYPASRVNTKKRRALIVEQLHRALCGVLDHESDVSVLTVD